MEKHNRRWRRRWQYKIDSIDLSWLPKFIQKIKEENGLDPNKSCVVCTNCRKPVKSDSEGFWSCECHGERDAENS